jgi:hypothetical protein
MFEVSHRPFQEIRFTQSEANTSQLNEIADWAASKAQYGNLQGFEEFFIAMPHPKHPEHGGQSFEEFTEDCPPLLKEILAEIYNTRLNQMKDEKWTSDFDLENDFGFILVAIL